jgi:hypothetical protein
MADFNPDEFLKLPVPKTPKVAPGVGTRAADPTPIAPAAPASATQAAAAPPPAEDPWYLKYGKEYGGPLVRGAGKEIAGDIQWAGEHMPFATLPGLPDAARQAREQAGQQLRDWTTSQDPEHPNFEMAGRGLGSVAEAYFMPLPKVAGLVGKTGERVGQWLYGKVPKGVPPAVRGAGGKMVANPAYQTAKEALAEKATGVAAKGEKVGKGVEATARGAVAGGLAQKEDPEAGVKIGGATAGAMSAVSSVVDAMPPTWKRAVDVGAAAAIVEYMHEKHGYGYGEASGIVLPWFLFHEIRNLKPAERGASMMASPLAQTGAAAGAPKVEEQLK